MQTPDTTGPAAWHSLFDDKVVIQLSGVVRRGDSCNIGILPEGSRPAFDSVFLCAAETGPAEITVRRDGLVTCRNSIPDAWVSLNNVHFVG